MPDLPVGIITFLFTDIEGSTPLWDDYPNEMRRAQKRHNDIIASCVQQNQGIVIHEKGEGDSAFCVFVHAPDALAAVCEIQRALHAEAWPERVKIRARAALHTGEAALLDGDYCSSDVNRCARLRGLARGGQILLSQSTRSAVGEALPDGVEFRSAGTHRLKGLKAPEKIYEAVVSGLRNDFPALESHQIAPTNLAAALSSFIGRETALDELESLLLLSGKRLITLTGTGGCGKTRLALAVAQNAREQFQDGTWLVELAPLSDPAQIPAAVAAALDIREAAGRSLIETLTAHLKNKTLLLLLDNCEHLIEDCARFVQHLLQSCPRLRILATSRETLNIPGEAAWRVPNLETPDPALLPALDVETVLRFDSARLLVERIQEKKPHFTLTAENALAAAQICHRLDGIPLALELAAARARSMSLQQIAANLDDRFRLLTGGARTAVQRQQTLQALLDWSYQLLSPTEQTIFQQAGVFVKGWTVEAAEAVCAEGVEVWDVLDILDRLVDKSLINAEDMGASARYTMLETLRQYSLTKMMDVSGATALRDRHRDYFLALAEEAAPHVNGAEQKDWLDRLALEHDNLRAALEWSAAEPALGLRLARSLWRFWHLRGHLREGRFWLTRFLQAVEAAPSTISETAPPQIYAAALHGAGTLALAQADYETAETLLTQSLTVWQSLGEEKSYAAALSSLAVCAYYQSDMAAARLLLEECLALRRRLNDTHGAADTLVWLGNIACGEGDYAAAQPRYQEGMLIYEREGVESSRAYALHNLGVCSHNQGPEHYAQARAFYEQGLAISRKHKIQGCTANILYCMGNLLREEDDCAAASRCLEESLALHREMGAEPEIAVVYWNLAAVAIHQNELPTAYAHLRESLALYQKLGQDAGIAGCLDGFAALLAAEGNSEPAAILLGKADAMREILKAAIDPADRPVRDRAIAKIRERLSESEFETARNNGAALSAAQALDAAHEFLASNSIHKTTPQSPV